MASIRASSSWAKRTPAAPACSCGDVAFLRPRRGQAPPGQLLVDRVYSGELPYQPRREELVESGREEGAEIFGKFLNFVPDGTVGQLLEDKIARARFKREQIRDANLVALELHNRCLHAVDRHLTLQGRCRRPE